MAPAPKATAWRRPRLWDPRGRRAPRGGLRCTQRSGDGGERTCGAALGAEEPQEEGGAQAVQEGGPCGRHAGSHRQDPRGGGGCGGVAGAAAGGKERKGWRCGNTRGSGATDAPHRRGGPPRRRPRCPPPPPPPLRRPRPRGTGGRGSCSFAVSRGGSLLDGLIPGQQRSTSSHCFPVTARREWRGPDHTPLPRGRTLPVRGRAPGGRPRGRGSGGAARPTPGSGTRGRPGSGPHT